jgi:hypothetical protein
MFNSNPKVNMENGGTYLWNKNCESVYSKDLFDVWRKLLETAVGTENKLRILNLVWEEIR